ncbi:hypothetical protein HMI54_001866 [Coelomomyces lativittatus]|nr:hypothetical protein HMI54_001866 [Coelomomyces lativittatus]
MTSTTQSNPSSSMTTPLLHHIETTHYSPSSSSSTTSTNFRLPELHQLRNKVIGNPSEKKKLLANLASLTSLAECITQVSFVYLPPSSSLFTLWPLSNVNDSLVLQQGLQAMVIFGSLAMWSDPCTRVLSDLDVVSSLLACLNGPPWVPLLEASTRALKAFAYNPHVSKTELLQVAFHSYLFYFIFKSFLPTSSLFFTLGVNLGTYKRYR